LKGKVFGQARKRPIFAAVSTYSNLICVILDMVI
jgi:hypothetical protein